MTFSICALIALSVWALLRRDKRHFEEEMRRMRHVADVNRALSQQPHVPYLRVERKK